MVGGAQGPALGLTDGGGQTPNTEDRRWGEEDDFQGVGGEGSLPRCRAAAPDG